MAKVLIISQARLQSKRFSKKILREIGGKSLLQIHLERLKKSKYSENLILATTYESGIQSVLDILKKIKIDYFQGSTNDVLDRYYKAAINYLPSYVVRVTSDCPLIDHRLLDMVIDFALVQNLDYVSNTLVEAYPDGQDIEVIKWSALSYAWQNAITLHQREHVTPYIRKNSTFCGGKIFSSKNFDCDHNLNNIRMTVDEIDDFFAIKTLIDKLGCDNDWFSYSNFIVNNPKLFSNQKIIRNEGSII
tara:strand:- start:761 stop:1501 length:741 start_codon:yes stop_codon:yes gene_type:complete